MIWGRKVAISFIITFSLRQKREVQQVSKCLLFAKVQLLHQGPLHQWKGPKILLPVIRRMADFSKQELSSSPWGNGALIQVPWNKDFWGPDTPVQFKSNFIPQGAWGSICNELFPTCVSLSLSLTIWACFPQMLQRDSPDILVFSHFTVPFSFLSTS